MAFFTKRYHPPGTAPGTLRKASPAEDGHHIRLIDYSPEAVIVREHLEPAECKPYLDAETITWVHVQGVPPERLLRELGASFGLHELALEDVINSGQRPKVETFEDQLFVVMALPVMDDGLVDVYQASFFFGRNFIVSFCQGDFTPFEPIVARLQKGAGALRTHGADFLLYSLLDVVVDQGFPVLENFGLQLENLEEGILEFADRETLADIHTIKRELILLRRMLWPQREVIHELLRDDFDMIHERTEIYLRDCYDHTIQVMELIETYREMTGSMLDIYLSSVNNRVNGVMRVLTIIATIFMPLTFIVGVYGMNFDPAAGPFSMPELTRPWGYVAVWIVMILIAALMLLLFRWRRWI